MTTSRQWHTRHLIVQIMSPQMRKEMGIAHQLVCDFTILAVASGRSTHPKHIDMNLTTPVLFTGWSLLPCVQLHPRCASIYVLSVITSIQDKVSTFARAQKLRTVFSPRQYFQFPYPSFPTSTALKHKFRNVPSHAKIVEKANS